MNYEEYFNNLKIDLHQKLDLFLEKTKLDFSKETKVCNFSVNNKNFADGFMIGYISSYLRELAGNSSFIKYSKINAVTLFQNSHKKFMQMLLKSFVKYIGNL